MADDVVELMLDQLLRNGSLDGSGLPLGKNTATRSSYEGVGRRSITLAMSLARRQEQNFGQRDVISSAYRIISL
jgi:hypothetical protein